MRRLPLVLCASILAISACSKSSNSNSNGSAPAAQPAKAAKEAGNQTIAAGLDQNGKFYQAAKAVGLETALAGPGPYTVFVPTDAAFAKLPAGTTGDLSKPADKAKMTHILTNLILQGTILPDDFGKAIDEHKGKVTETMMGGGTVTIAKNGGNLVLTDGSGGTATVQGDAQKRSNGVVYSIDSVLMPKQTTAKSG